MHSDDTLCLLPGIHNEFMHYMAYTVYIKCPCLFSANFILIILYRRISFRLVSNIYDLCGKKISSQIFWAELISSSFYNTAWILIIAQRKKNINCYINKSPIHPAINFKWKI